LNENKKEIRMTELFDYLQKKGLSDQIHIRGGEQKEYIFYHWNKVMSNLIPSIIVKNDFISEIRYPREFMPLVFIKINYKVINDLTKEHKFVRGFENEGR
jgi:hypothetical protein